MRELWSLAVPLFLIENYYLSRPLFGINEILEITVNNLEKLMGGRQPRLTLRHLGSTTILCFIKDRTQTYTVFLLVLSEAVFSEWFVAP